MMTTAKWNTKGIKPGSLVRFTSAFLNGIQWHTDVPINGFVVRLIDVGKDTERAEVWWCDDDATDHRRVLVKNIELDPDDSKLSDTMRESLMREATGKHDYPCDEDDHRNALAFGDYYESTGSRTTYHCRKCGKRIGGSRA